MSEHHRAIDVSIVVVHWNVPRLLDACLTSIVSELEASTLSAELIVIDNHSSEPEYRDVVQIHPDVRLLELDENRGYGAASNVGIGIAQGKAVLILNPDTVMLPGSLDKLWQTLNLSPHIGLVAPLLLNPDRSVQSMGYAFPGPANVFFDLFPLHPRLYESGLNGRSRVGNGELPRAIDYALGAALFARRSALLQAGLFDEGYFMYSEEIDLQRRLANLNWTRLLAPDARVIHYGGQSTGQRSAEMQVALWESRARYFRRWASRRDRAVIRTIVELGTRMVDLRHPDRRATNLEIRNMFRHNLAGPR